MVFPTNQIGKKDKEIVIFGKGYGESILIHLSGHKYVLIDNFINNDTGNPIALDYLKSVGLSANNIIGIVCTHWDNDHCKGLFDLIDKNMTGTPDVYIPGIHDLKTIEHILSLANSQFQSTKEIVNVMQFSKAQLSPVLEGMLLFSNKMPIVDNQNVSLLALSPSRKLYGDYIRSIINKNKKPNLLKSFSANDLSAVVVASIGQEKILLGADMENKKGYGWDYINDVYVGNVSGCSIFKVPHHGSSNAYSKKTISLLKKESIAVITRFNVGKHPLPDEDMIKKYSKDCHVYVVGKKLDTVVPSFVEGDLNKQNIVIDDNPGFVRLINKKNSSQWICEKYGSVLEY